MAIMSQQIQSDPAASDGTPVLFIFVTIIAVMAMVLSVGCEKKAADEIDFGTFSNSVYHNEYFGMTITLPPDWHAQGAEEREQLMKLGGEVVAGDDKNLKAKIKIMEKQTLSLFVAFKHPVGAPVPFNPAIMCVAERVRQLPGIRNGKDYLWHAKRLLESGQLEVTISEGFSTEKLGGRVFDVMDVEIPSIGALVQQKYYATIIKGYVLAFIASYTTEDELLYQLDIFKSVTFN